MKQNKITSPPQNQSRDKKNQSALSFSAGDGYFVALYVALYPVFVPKDNVELNAVWRPVSPLWRMREEGSVGLPSET